MERRRKIPFGNREVEAIEMTFQTGGEHWNEYVLNDGSVVRLKPVVTEILRAEGEYDNEGNPVYVIKATTVVSVSASERARRPSKE